jgi:hypothetical protein
MIEVIQDAASFVEVDTLQVPTEVLDTLRVAVDSVVAAPDIIINVPGDPLLELILGVIIAGVASYLTYFLTKHQERQKTRTNYIGILKSAHAEVCWIGNHTRRLKNTVLEVKRVSMIEGDFAVDSTPEPIHLEWIESCRARLLEYEKVNMQLVHLLSHYINLIRDTNRSLDFRAAKSLIVDVSESERNDALQEYFDTLTSEFVGKVETASGWIIELIKKELSDLNEDSDLVPPPQLKGQD